MRRGWRAIAVLLGALAPLAGCGGDVGGRPEASAPLDTAPPDTAAADTPAPVQSPMAPTVSGMLTGLYVDVGAGPLFTDCGTSRQWRIHPDEAAGELRRRYLALRSRTGDASRVTLEAHSTASEGGQLGELVVDSVTSVSALSTCPGHPAGAPLTGTTWRMTRLADRDLTTLDGEVTLRLDGGTGTLQSGTLCGSLTGTFRWIGTELTFGGIEVGEGTCAGSSAAGTVVDAGVLNAFRGTGSYRIRGDTLDLMGESGVLARLVAKGVP